MTIQEMETLSEMEQVFYPWRRFFARTMDIIIYSSVWSIFLVLLFHVNVVNRSGMEDFFDTVMALLIMMFVEPLLLHLFGTTLGKVILGLRIKNTDGRRLSYREGLERTWGVLRYGIGYNIPIYNLFRLWKSYKLCSKNEIQPWDEYISYTIKDTKWYRTILFILTNALLLGIFAFTVLFSELPPNHGNLTVSEFAENYNYIADYFDVDMGRYLDKNGHWAKMPENGIYYADMDFTVTPEFSYTIENGYVTGISFELELKNNNGWLYSNDMQMALAVLSFVDTHEKIGIFSNVRDDMVEQIKDNSFEDFSFTEAGVNVRCNVEYSGYYYDNGSGMLIPEEPSEKTYYRIEFFMNKTK